MGGTLISADGAYHCPVGSIMAIFSSVRSSYSHPDLLLIHPPHFFRSHRSSTLDFHFLSHYSTAVRRHCTDWYEICALTDHEIYYIKIELDLRKFSNGPFSETEKAFWVNPTPGGSQCTALSPSFGPFFERNHSFGVKMVSQNFPKCFKSWPL